MSRNTVIVLLVLCVGVGALIDTNSDVFGWFHFDERLGTYWTLWSGADGSIGGFVFYSLDQCFFDLFQAIGKGV